jgi:hypothetical protein
MTQYWVITSTNLEALQQHHESVNNLRAAIYVQLDIHGQ